MTQRLSFLLLSSVFVVGVSSGTGTLQGPGSSTMMVFETWPRDSQTNVSVHGSVIIEFDVPMLNQTSARSAFSISPAVPGNISFQSRWPNGTEHAQMVKRFDRSLQYETMYSVKIALTATSSTGIPLDRDYRVNFTTGKYVPPPRVLSTTPADHATNVNTNASVSVEFDQDIALATPTEFSVSPTVQGDLNVSGRILRWTHGASLLENTTYALKIGRALVYSKWGGGGIASSFYFNFTTGWRGSFQPPAQPPGDAWSSLPPPVAGFFRQWFYALAAASLGACLFSVAAVTAWRRGFVEDVYLVYRDGRLIKHIFRRAKPMDADAFTSMLTAMQAFVADSMSGEAGALDEFRFGGVRFVIHRGQRVFIAAAYRGPNADAVRQALRACVGRIEAGAWQLLDRWDGKVEPLVRAVETEVRKVSTRRF